MQLASQDVARSKEAGEKDTGSHGGLPSAGWQKKRVLRENCETQFGHISPMIQWRRVKIQDDNHNFHRPMDLLSWNEVQIMHGCFWSDVGENCFRNLILHNFYAFMEGQQRFTSTQPWLLLLKRHRACEYTARKLWSADTVRDSVDGRNLWWLELSQQWCFSLRAHADVCSIFSIRLIELVIIITVD